MWSASKACRSPSVYDNTAVDISALPRVSLQHIRYHTRDSPLQGNASIALTHDNAISVHQLVFERRYVYTGLTYKHNANSSPDNGIGNSYSEDNAYGGYW